MSNLLNEVRANCRRNKMRAEQPTLYVMVGVPGSGKTTYVRRNLRDALRISLDDLRLMFSGKTFDAQIEPAVAIAGDAILDALVGSAASLKRDIVFDATNVSRSRRARLIELARRHGLSPIAIFINCPLTEAQSRNQQRAVPVPAPVVKQFGQRLEPPTIDEGFVDVIHVCNSRTGENPSKP